jgi:hypothetical protein
MSKASTGLLAGRGFGSRLAATALATGIAASTLACGGQTGSSALAEGAGESGGGAGASGAAAASGGGAGAAGAAAASGTGGGGTDAAADAGQELEPGALECASIIDSLDEPPSDYTAVLGAVAIGGSDSSPTALQVHPKSGLWFAKSGLLVRAGSASTLTIPHKWRDDFAISWGNAERSWELEIPDCASDAVWHVYAGGYWVREPACVPLTVMHDGQERTVMLGVGLPCTDQAPAP